MQVFDIRDNGKDAHLKYKMLGTEIFGLKPLEFVEAGRSGYCVENNYDDLVTGITATAEKWLADYNRINKRLKHKPCKSYSIVGAAVWNYGWSIVFKMHQ